MMKTQGFSSLVVLVLCAWLSTSASAQTTCEKYGTINAGAYRLQNNVWGADTRQCIEKVGSTGFRVTESAHNLSPGLPASYPSIWKGCHWDNCTSNSGMPIRVDEIGSASFSWNISVINSGTWNAAPEAWFKRNSTPGAPDGTELMFWYNWRGSVQPGGSKIGEATIDGVRWDVWYANPGWHFITYRRQQKTTNSTINLMPFIADAKNRGYLRDEWYLMDMEAGFELWKGGAGLRTNSFSFDVTKRGSGGGGGATPPNNYVEIRARHSGKCLDVAGYSRSNGGNIHQWGCHGGRNQKFRFESVGGGWYQVRSQHSNRCLNIAGYNRNNGGNVIQWSCSGNQHRNMHFRLEDRGGGWFQLRARDSNRCLDVAGISRNNGANIQQWACGGGQNQQFRIVN